MTAPDERVVWTVPGTASGPSCNATPPFLRENVVAESHFHDELIDSLWRNDMMKSGVSRRPIGVRESRRRKFIRETLPAAIALILLLAAVGTWGTARAGPLVCQTYVPVSASVTTNPTNVTISWNIGDPSSVLLYWGNTTNYGFTAINGTVYGSGGYTTPLDYLEPSTTYYFHLIATESPGYPGVCPGSLASHWGTPYDPLNQFSGRVTDVNGNPPPEAGIEVFIRCAGPLQWNEYYSEANSAGYFTSQNLQKNCTSIGGYAITAFAGSPTGSPYTNWLGHWNETIVVWAPQTVNFYLPRTFLSPTLVNYALFTNSADVNLEFCEYTSSSYSYTTSTTVNVGILGLGSSYSSSIAVGGTFGSGGCTTTFGEPSDEEWGSYNTSGGILVNNVAGRSVINLWTQYYGGKYGGGFGSSGPLANPVSEPDSNATACFAENTHWYQQIIGPHSEQTISLGASGTISKLGSDTLNFNVGSLLAPLVLIPGIGEVSSAILASLTLSSTWGYSWSTTHTDGFNVTADIITGATGGTFTAACQGSSTAGQGLAIEVWQDS